MPSARARAVLVLLLLATAACSRDKAATQAQPLPGPSLDPARPLPSPLPEIVARVNGSPVSIRQVLPIARVALDRVSLAQRDEKLPLMLRRAVQEYVERELLLQEALARGISADKREVDWAYDQARREHADEAAWVAHLAEQALDPQFLKAELRIRHTVAALIEDEARKVPLSEAELRAVFEANSTRFGAPGGEPPSFESVRGEVEAAVRRERGEQAVAALVARLRAKARIEIYL